MVLPAPLPTFFFIFRVLRRFCLSYRLPLQIELSDYQNYRYRKKYRWILVLIWARYQISEIFASPHMIQYILPIFIRVGNIQILKPSVDLSIYYWKSFRNKKYTILQYRLEGQSPPKFETLKFKQFQKKNYAKKLFLELWVKQSQEMVYLINTDLKFSQVMQIFETLVGYKRTQ